MIGKKFVVCDHFDKVKDEEDHTTTICKYCENTYISDNKEHGTVICWLMSRIVPSTLIETLNGRKP